MKLATFGSSSTTRMRIDRQEDPPRRSPRGETNGGAAASRLPVSAVGLRRHPEVGLQCLVALGELLLELLRIGERRDDHAVVSLLPVGGSRHLVAVGELERIEDAQDL